MRNQIAFKILDFQRKNVAKTITYKDLTKKIRITKRAIKKFWSPLKRNKLQDGKVQLEDETKQYLNWRQLRI